MQRNYRLASPMRPRALLDATAIGLLLAVATVWAAPPGLIPETAHGQKAPVPGSLPGPQGERPESTIKKPSALPGLLGERPEWLFKTPEQTAALKQRAGVEQLLKQVRDPHLKPLCKILVHKTGLSGSSIVNGAVKQFSTDFERGFKNPDRFMSEVSLNQRPLVDEWLAVPQEKRIFVIGSGKDSAKVSELTESLESHGYKVFFYDFCRQSSGVLCSSQAVGAMCGKSGITMLYQTPFAEHSEYVKVEVATAGFLEGLNDKVVFISTSELLAAKSFAMYVANLPTPTPSAVK